MTVTPEPIGSSTRSPLLVPLIAGVIGAAAMTICLGPALVNPVNIDWLMHLDYRLHFLGWHLYRGGPWTMPLGAAPLLIAPIGSSVGLTDAIPIVALPLKVFEALLPANFQFIGLWLVLSFALQGVFGALLMQIATPRPALQLLGAVHLILSPPLVFRILHAALTAHWLILAALWLALNHDADTPSWKTCTAWALLCAAAAATQPYIMLMILLMMAAAYARQAIASPRRLLLPAMHGAIALAATYVSLWQSGSLMISSGEGLTIAGFGGWSANLLTFIMPTEAGSYLSPGPIRYASGGQYEGFAYLGAGTLLLVGLVSVARIAALRSWTTWRAIGRRLPLIVALLILAAMAVGPVVTFGSRTLFTYHPSWWGPLTIFRTQGRMIWPLFYALTVAVLFAASRFQYRRAVAVMGVALSVQAIDVAPMARYIQDRQVFGFLNPLQSRFWKTAAPHYRQFVMVPSSLCTSAGYVDFSGFSLLAGQHGLGINSGDTARYDTKKAARYCTELAEDLDAGMRNTDALYVIRPDLVPDLIKRIPDRATQCTYIDGFGVCFDAGGAAAWRRTFDPIRSRLPSADEFVAFYQQLDEVYATALGRQARDVNGAIADRVEGLARYMSSRMEGCTHEEAAAFADTATPAAQWCATTSPEHLMPPSDQTLAFLQQLDRSLGTRAATRGTTHVDIEGEAVWLQAYARERARGARPDDARARVLASIRGDGR